MFSGIVEKVGSIRKVRQGPRGLLCLEIEARNFTGDMKKGDSVSVNGVCLTAVRIRAASFEVDVVSQTQAVTTLGLAQPGQQVNLAKLSK
jgi:riboflavin synthase